VQNRLAPVAEAVEKEKYAAHVRPPEKDVRFP